MKSISVLLVQPQLTVRRALRLWLSAEPDVAVVDEAATASEGFALAQALHPTIVLIDASILEPGRSAAVVAWRTRLPRTTIVLLSIHDDPSEREPTLEHDAAPLVSMLESPKRRLATIRRAARTGA